MEISLRRSREIPSSVSSVISVFEPFLFPRAPRLRVQITSASKQTEK
jgi:hypothetical protein